MREILGRRRRLLTRWHFGLRSGGSEERSGSANGARAGRASRTDDPATTGAARTDGPAATPGGAEGRAGENRAVDGRAALDAEASGAQGDADTGRRGADRPRRSRWGTGGSWRSGARSGGSGSRTAVGKKGRLEIPEAALTAATEWGWPVLPGVGLQQRTVGLQPRGGDRCACPDPDCTVPGAHPFDPGLLAATTDERMVRWWWDNRPTAPIIMATGGRAPCAVSLPAVPAARALAALDRREIRLGPVLATPTRWSILVAPYSMEQLGDLLYAKDFVPGSLRFHSEGGYLALPPSRTGQGRVRWERAPLPGSAAPWVPDVEAVVDAVVDALTHRGVSAPEM